jgi:hypothetical protein
MVDQQGTDKLVVRFGNGRTAAAVRARTDSHLGTLLDQLGLAPSRAVILVIGGADSLTTEGSEQLAELLARGVVRVAADAPAVVVDGGTDAGVMALTGQAVARDGHRVVLVGVAPEAKVAYSQVGTSDDARVPLEPNHSHFVLVDGTDWGDTTETMLSFVDALVGRPPSVAAVVVGGGPVARAEVAEVARRRWPVVLITGTGGVADELAHTIEDRRDGSGSGAADRELREIAAGVVGAVPRDRGASDLRALLIRHLGRDRALESAWELLARYNDGAKREQAEFRRIQRSTLIVGVVGTFLAVLYSSLGTTSLDGHWLRERALRYAIVLAPIVLAAMVAAAARFRAGSKWVVLRGAAEAVKREIFRYRARVGPYQADRRAPREVALADRVGTISSSVMKSEVNLSPTRPDPGDVPPPDCVAAGDDGYSALDPEHYVEWRLLDQVRWYEERSVTLEREARRARWLAIGFGGLGTFLAAIGFELWIAVTTAVIGACTSYLDYMQTENTLLQYNQAAASLETIRRWWLALPPREQLDARNVGRLVERSERIMRSELAGWMQDMHDTMADLSRAQERPPDEVMMPSRPEPGRATDP